MTMTGSPESFDLASILWRDGRLGDPGRAGRETAVHERYVAVPRTSEIRQLLPWRWSSIAATGRRRSDDRSRRKQVRDMLGVTYLLGLGAMSSSHRVSASGAASMIQHVAAELGHDDALGIVLCGPPRANEKPVIQLHDRRGRTLAYVKVGWNDLTKRLIGAETETLERLAGRRIGFVVPEILATGTFGGASWLAIAPVRVETRRPPTPASIDALARSIEATGDPWSGRVPDSCFVHELRATTTSLPRSGPLVAELAERHADREISHGAAHGDFVPWNILSGAPRTAVWDWERYRPSTPLGYDRLHHRVQVGVHRGSSSIRDTLIGVDHDLGAILADVPVDQRHTHFHWYLADIMARYERDLIENPAPLLPRLVDDIHEHLRDRLTSP